MSFIEKPITIFSNQSSPEQNKKRKSDINTILTNIKTYCREQIGKEYAKESLEDRASKIYVLKNSKGEIRGFASVIIYNNSKNKYYYIDLICTAEYHKMKTRANIDKVSGKDLMNKIIEDAVKDKAQYIKLKAIESVISYYNIVFGFNFKNKVYNLEEKQKETNLIKELIKVQNESKKLKEEGITQRFLKSKREFIKAIEGYYTEADLRQRLATPNFSDKIENGFTMYKQLQNFTGKGKRKTRKVGKSRKIKSRKGKSRKGKSKKIKTRKGKSKKIKSRKRETRKI